MKSPDWLLYGAYGYTGRRIAEASCGRGLRPVLAGRDAGRLRVLADSLDCPSRVFSLDRPDQLAESLSGFRAVLNCAGPFSATAEPMMEACLAAGVHYLDVTGEIPVIEAAAQRHERGAAMGVSLIPAVGFDVVPSDCLAAMLAQRLPGAIRLALAFTSSGGVSPGTAKTMLEGLAGGGRVRVDGRIVRVPWAFKSLDVPLPDGPRPALAIPWGDVASAWYSTGIGNIETYLTLPPRPYRWLRRVGWLLPVLKSRPMQCVLRWSITRLLRGPSETTGGTGRCWLWGRVEDASGARVEATLETPGAYPFTVSASLACMERVLSGAAPVGFSTPSKAFGADFVLQLPGTYLRWS